MSEIRTVTTLKAKREEIQFSIRLYEDRIKQARADLAHVNAAIKIFEASGETEEMGKYVDTHRLYGYGESNKLFQEALSSGPKSTREIALHMMEAKGLDTRDKVLAKAVAGRIIHALRGQASRGKIVRVGKKGTAIVWRLP